MIRELSEEAVEMSNTIKKRIDLLMTSDNLYDDERPPSHETLNRAEEILLGCVEDCCRLQLDLPEILFFYGDVDLMWKRDGKHVYVSVKPKGESVRLYHRDCREFFEPKAGFESFTLARLKELLHWLAE